MQQFTSNPIQHDKYNSINKKVNNYKRIKIKIITPKIVYESCAIGCTWNMINI